MMESSFLPSASGVSILTYSHRNETSMKGTEQWTSFKIEPSLFDHASAISKLDDCSKKQFLSLTLEPNSSTPVYSSIRANNSSKEKPLKEKTRDESTSKKRIASLLEKIPEIRVHFDIHQKIGEGTFSSVYVATCKTLPQKKKFAIKHLIPTTHPNRILQELRCLKEIGGKDNVAGIEMCFRRMDCVAFILPYFPHNHFSEYCTEMTVAEMQDYMKNLLIALKRVHDFDIIHRDVKPSNFLYNRKDKTYLLVDFGLSHSVAECLTKFKHNKKRKWESDEKECTLSESKRRALHSLSNNLGNKASEQGSPVKTIVAVNSPRANRSKDPMYSEMKSKSPSLGGVLLKENSSAANRTAAATTATPSPRKINKAKRSLAFDDVPAKKLFRGKHSNQPEVQAWLDETLRIPYAPAPFKSDKEKGVRCDCDGKARVCNVCLMREPMNAPRAGTPGYRPPEVLMRFQWQTTAVDIWAAGVIMLCIMSRSYPFFKAPDDMTALMEITYLFGTNTMEDVARKLGRKLQCGERRKPCDFRRLCESLRQRKRQTIEFLVPADRLPDSAFDLLGKLLCVDPEHRWTAAKALDHPFFKENFRS